MEDFYQTLGLNREASKREIFKAYQKLALYFHPERNSAKSAEKQFVEVNKAYQVLGNKAVKKWYDPLHDKYLINKELKLTPSEESKGQEKVNEAIQKGEKKGKAYSPYSIFSKKVIGKGIWEGFIGFVALII